MMPEPNLTFSFFDQTTSSNRLLLNMTFLSLLVADVFLTGCSRQPLETVKTAEATTSVRTVADLSYLTPRAVGSAFEAPPWISHALAVDLDLDGRLDLVFCEAKQNQAIWLRQSSAGAFTESVLANNLRTPVHIVAADIDGDGDLDLVVASMGEIFPNNDRIGTVFILENDGRQNFTPRIVLENTTRVTDVQVSDLNHDGRLDLVLAQFGYDQGEVSWLERTGPWEFRRHVMLELSGAINVCVADFNADGNPDVAALLSQQWEEIYVFKNDGRGNFATQRIWGSTNEDFGSSGISVCDLNRDGRPDIIYSNGDGFGPATTPGPRPWHGVQWLENLGDGQFRYRRIGNLPGAYSPIGTDLDGDGAMDVVAVAAYADWNDKKRRVTSLMWFRNDGAMNFEPRVLAQEPKDQIAMAAGDFDGNGRIALMTGGFYVFPPYQDMSRITLWRRTPRP